MIIRGARSTLGDGAWGLSVLLPVVQIKEIMAMKNVIIDHATQTAGIESNTQTFQKMLVFDLCASCYAGVSIYCIIIENNLL